MNDLLTSRRKWIGTLGISTIANSFASDESKAAEDDGKKSDKKQSTSTKPTLDKEKEEVTKIELSKVPPKIRNAATKALRDAKWTMAFRVKDDDSHFYELEGTDAKGREVVMTLTDDGVVDEIETRIKLKDLPETVSKALHEKMPRFKALRAHELTEQDMVSGYEVDGRRPKDKHDITVHVSPDGKTVEIDEADVGDDPGDDDEKSDAAKP